MGNDHERIVELAFSFHVLEVILLHSILILGGVQVDLLPVLVGI